ncbi:hypothetical protein BK120_23525 [Paenibacillus sp. FSL A5-0031]|uniref:hypothetical protein n=1 Tax=Paenibacillus sp. FSL A5-0031 TaxID=1920420 RepID=UPI00096FB451|nr:hypothetical protein [Paenibacillus sp. FSL A5-0031]OME78709.1 hypothetical protein BK120_23525 [Paenibacillus sp. FSL A5-0031]
MIGLIPSSKYNSIKEKQVLKVDGTGQIHRVEVEALVETRICFLSEIAGSFSEGKIVLILNKSRIHDAKIGSYLWSIRGCSKFFFLSPEKPDGRYLEMG